MTGRPPPQPALSTAIAVVRAVVDPSTGVGANTPRIWPRLFVHMSMAGGSEQTFVTDAARLLVECYADSDAACEGLINQCRGALRNTQGHTVNGVFLRGWDNESGPVKLDNPKVADHRRWQFQGDLLVSNSATTPATLPPPARPIDEIQLITIDGNPNGGTYLLGFMGPMCDPPLKYNANAADMQDALCALPTVGVGNLLVSKQSGGPWYDVLFQNELGAMDVPLLDVDYTNLNRGSVTVSVAVEGSAGTARRRTPN